MRDSVTGQGTKISRYRSKRQKSRAVSNHAATVSDAISMAASNPVQAAVGSETIAFCSSNDHGRTVNTPYTLQPTQFDAETPEHEDTATDVYGNKSVNVSSLFSKRGHSLCAVRTRSLHSIEQSLNHPQPTMAQHQDVPPKSSEINATTTLKTRHVPKNDNERHTGCFNFFRRGKRCRAESACAAQVAVGSSLEDPAVRYICSACSESTHEQSKAIIVKGAESEVSGRTYAQGYHRGRAKVSGPPQEPAEQDSVNYLAVNTASRDWRSLGRPDLAMNPSSKDFETLSPRTPYDMRYGAVQPQYFCTDETSIYRQIARSDFEHGIHTQRSTTTSSVPSDLRSSTKLYTSPSIRPKPLVDLTPQYQPPPQHRNRGHGYHPEQLGSGKLVDYATSPKK